MTFGDYIFGCYTIGIGQLAIALLGIPTYDVTLLAFLLFGYCAYGYYEIGVVILVVPLLSVVQKLGVFLLLYFFGILSRSFRGTYFLLLMPVGCCGMCLIPRHWC